MSKKDKNKDVAVEDKKQSSKTNEKNTVKSDENSVDKLEQELKAEKERYLRLFAEFENYKKRTSRERIEFFKTASQDLMVALLPVIDDFDRALKELDKNEDDEHFKGVSLINNKFVDTLKVKGLEPIGTEKGDNFDAELHEAITQIPAPSDELKGKIIDVIEKGYKLGDKIIRYPKVVIGQ